MDTSRASARQRADEASPRPRGHRPVRIPRSGTGVVVGLNWLLLTLKPPRSPDNACGWPHASRFVSLTPSPLHLTRITSRCRPTGYGGGRPQPSYQLQPSVLAPPPRFSPAAALHRRVWRGSLASWLALVGWGGSARRWERSRQDIGVLAGCCCCCWAPRGLTRGGIEDWPAAAACRLSRKSGSLLRITALSTPKAARAVHCGRLGAREGLAIAVVV